MRKGSDLHGLTIYSRNKGKRIDTINDVIFDHNDNMILGFVVNNGGWFSDAQVISWSNVETIGDDGVIIRTEDVVVSAEETPRIQNILAHGNVLQGTEVMTVGGKNLGSIKDFFFDPVSGIIEGYEVSGGIFADAMTGRSYMPAPSVFNIGEDVAFVPDVITSYMEEQVGGIKGQMNSMGDSISTTVDQTTTALTDMKDTAVENISAAASTTGETLSAAASTTGDKLSELSEATKVKTQDALSSVQDSATAAMASTSVQEAKGRRVRTAVFASESQYLYIASAGQIVTDKIIEEAVEFGREKQLLEAVNLSVGDAVNSKASNDASSLADTTANAAGSAWTSIKDVAASVKESVLDAKASTEEMVEQKRIEAALGRPVTRVILDKSDAVILDKGEIVTHEAVDRARSADVLNILLSSATAAEDSTGNTKVVTTYK